jgi:HEAT repeat protein
VPVAESLAIVLSALDDDARDVATAASTAIPALIAANSELARDRTLYAALRAAKDHGLAGRTLGRIGTADAHEALLKMFATRDPELVSAALDGLWDAGNDEDLRLVRPLLRAWTLPALRKKACLLVGHLHDGDAVSDLIDALREDEPGLVANAGWALCEITGRHLDPDPDLWTDWWERGGREEIARRDAAAADPSGEPAVTRPTPTIDAPREPRARASTRPASVASMGAAPLAGFALALLVAAAMVFAHRRIARRLIVADRARVTDGGRSARAVVPRDRPPRSGA